MKRIYIKGILGIAKLLMLMGVGACSDNGPEYVKPGELHGAGDGRTTVVYLRPLASADWTGADNLSFSLESPSTLNTLKFDGHVRAGQSTRGEESLACHICIGQTDIPDGDYFLKIEGDGVPELGLRKVRFMGNVGEEAATGSMSYDDLEGSGTQTDPYRINDDGDFLTLIWYLEDDPDHGYGKHFLQTESFDVPRRSQIIDGHIYAPVQFSGTYDGGGHELRNLTYQGASNKEQDSGIGLFSYLYSATVKNVTFSNVLILNAGEKVGALAGSASGNCRYENIVVSGTITAASDDIGGVVGRSEGTAEFRDITLRSLVVNGGESSSYRVGLMLGSHLGDNLTVDNVRTPDHIFSVTGKERVGGLVGEVKCKGVSISNVTLEHSVDQESNNIRVVYGGGRFVGGLVGWFENNNDNSCISSCAVKMPVCGTQDVGGIAGHAFLRSLKLQAIQLSSTVRGEDKVGGFFGYVGFADAGGELQVDASDGRTCYVVKSSADAEVMGGQNTGGMIGYFDANHGQLKVNGKIEIAVNVRGSENVGGAFGFANHLSDFNPYSFYFSSTTMRVEASGDNAGGLAGTLDNSTLDGGLRLNPVKQIPNASSLESAFSGVVTAANNAGGVVGKQNGKITGVCSSATVTAKSGDAGGIAGCTMPNVNNSAFTGRVDAKKSGGGIYGICFRAMYMHDNINYGEVYGGDYGAGIAAYTNGQQDDEVNITHCYNEGKISGASAAGIAAYICISDPIYHLSTLTQITECGNRGEIHGTGNIDRAVGGIVASFLHLYAKVISCANHGKVSASGDQYAVGGVVGEIGDRKDGNYGTEVQMSMNSGEVSCAGGSTHIGGVVGHFHSGRAVQFVELKDCYNTGSIPSDPKSDTGGLLGYAASYTLIYHTFNRGQVSHGNAIVGTHHSGSNFHHRNNYFLEGTGGDWPSSTKVSKNDIGKQDVYHDFDFANVWQITSDGPILRNCPFQ